MAVSKYWRDGVGGTSIAIELRDAAGGVIVTWTTQPVGDVFSAMHLNRTVYGTGSS